MIFHKKINKFEAILRLWPYSKSRWNVKYFFMCNFSVDFSPSNKAYQGETASVTYIVVGVVVFALAILILFCCLRCGGMNSCHWWLNIQQTLTLYNNNLSIRYKLMSNCICNYIWMSNCNCNWAFISTAQKFRSALHPSVVIKEKMDFSLFRNWERE